MSARITSGPAEVVASGTVTAFHGHPLTVRVAIAGHGAIALGFRFVSDPDRDDVAAAGAPTEEGMDFVLTNFDDADGRGSSQPVLVGELGELLVFLHFRVFRYGKTADRTLHYCVYTALKQELGWQGQEP